MAAAHSNETILKQLGSGILSGSVVGVLMGRGHYLSSTLAFSSIGLLDAAYHFNYLKTHLTHLTYEQSNIRRDLRSHFTNFQRSIQRELRELPEDNRQEFEWLWADLKRHIDTHIYYGMGFTVAFLLSTVLCPKGRH